MTPHNDQYVRKVKGVASVIAPTVIQKHCPGMSATPKTSIPNDVIAEMAPERIGYRLGLLRETVGLSKSEMADSLGIERTYWSRFETGKRPVSYNVGALLAARYGVTLDFLILGRWDKLPHDLAVDMRATEARLSSRR